MISIIQHIFSFVLLVLIQVLVLNNIQFLGYINPYIYILFLLSLPVQVPRWAVLILAFLLGMSIDVFSNTPGMHSFATVLIAFFKDGVIKLFTSIEEGNNPSPSFHTLGVSAYMKYLITMVIIHHTTLFVLESFSFSNIWIILGKTLLSSFITILLIAGIQSLKSNKK